MVPRPGRPAPARAVLVLIKGVLVALTAALAVALSVVASVAGLSLPLAAAAIGALTVLKIRQRARSRHTPPRSWAPLLIAGLAIAGFFIVASVVAAYWPR